jgi:hypothetical protein
MTQGQAREAKDLLLEKHNNLAKQRNTHGDKGSGISKMGLSWFIGG